MASYWWYLDGFGNEVAGGHAVSASPETIVWLPATANVEMRLGTGSELALPFWEGLTGRLVNLGCYVSDGTRAQESTDRYYADNVFCEDNLVSHDENEYVFRTRYSRDLSGVLPRSALAERQPQGDRRAYVLDSVPDEVRELADAIVRKNGSSEDLAGILSGIHAFITYGERPMFGPHTTIPLEALAEEYASTGSFSGDCKERLLFAQALCTALDIPCRGVSGKSYSACGHVWAEAYAPTAEGHLWVPLCSLTEFNTLDPLVQILWGHVPGPVPEKQSFWDFLLARKKAPPLTEIALSVQRV